MLRFKSWPSIATSFLLFVLLMTTGSTKNNDDDLVDPYAWDYDRSTKTNKGTKDDWNKPGGEVDCSSDHLKRACSGCGYAMGPEESIPAEKPRDSGDVNLFRHVTRSISEHFEQNPDTESLVLTLSSYQREKLLKYVNDEDVPKVDIKDMLATSWIVPYSPSSSEGYTILGFTQNEVIIGGLIILLSVSIFLMALTFHVSLLRVIFAVCFTALVISFLWSYMFLYQQKIAKRMSDDALRDQYNEICQSSKNVSFLGGIRKFFRRGDDPCEKYFHDHQVHIALEVLPVDAITHTLGAIMTSISGFFGVSLGEISGGFLGSLSFAMWVPASIFLLIFVVAILAVWMYCGGRQQGPVRIEPPGQRYAIDDGSRDGARYRKRGNDRLEEAYPPWYAITQSSYYGDRGDDRLKEAHPRRNDTIDSSRDDVHYRDDIIEETSSQRYAGKEVGRRTNVDRGLQGMDDVIRGHPDRREDKCNLRHRGLHQAGDVRDQEQHDDDRMRGEDQGSGMEMDRGNEVSGTQAAGKTISRGNIRDVLVLEVDRHGGSCEGGVEGRVEEIGHEGPTGAGDQKELKNVGQSPPVQSPPDSTGTEIKQSSPEAATDPATPPDSTGTEIKQSSPEATDPATAEEYISEDDFEVIPEE